jgi:hypothetical protein
MINPIGAFRDTLARNLERLGLGNLGLLNRIGEIRDNIGIIQGQAGRVQGATRSIVGSVALIIQDVREGAGALQNVYRFFSGFFGRAAHPAIENGPQNAPPAEEDIEIEEQERDLVVAGRRPLDQRLAAVAVAAAGRVENIAEGTQRVQRVVRGIRDNPYPVALALATILSIGGRASPGVIRFISAIAENTANPVLQTASGAIVLMVILHILEVIHLARYNEGVEQAVINPRDVAPIDIEVAGIRARLTGDTITLSIAGEIFTYGLGDTEEGWNDIVLVDRREDGSWHEILREEARVEELPMDPGID